MQGHLCTCCVPVQQVTRVCCTPGHLCLCCAAVVAGVTEPCSRCWQEQDWRLEAGEYCQESKYRYCSRFVAVWFILVIMVIVVIITYVVHCFLHHLMPSWTATLSWVQDCVVRAHKAESVSVDLLGAASVLDSWWLLGADSVSENVRLHPHGDCCCIYCSKWVRSISSNCRGTSHSLSAAVKH